MSSGENDPGAGKGSSGGPPLVAKGGVRSERQRLIVISLLAMATISGFLFGGKLVWDVQQRQYSETLERFEAVDNISVEQDRLNVALANLGAKFEQIEARALNLEQRFDVLSGELASIAEDEGGSREWEARYRRVASQISKLRREVVAVQESSSGHKFSQGGALLLLARLRVDLLQGRPCGVQLESVRSFLGEMENLAGLFETLTPFCENGVITRSQLEHEFGLVVNDIMYAADVSADGGWGDRIHSAFRRLVTIRPINPGGNSRGPADILAKTEAFLMSGNLDDALTTIEKLSLANNGGGVGWIDSLKQRVTAIEIIDQIIGVLIQEIEKASGQND